MGRGKRDKEVPRARRGTGRAPGAAGTPGAWILTALMRDVFDLDVPVCPRCGGRVRVIATVQDPLVVQAILTPGRARSGMPAAFGQVAQPPLSPTLPRQGEGEVVGTSKTDGRDRRRAGAGRGAVVS